MALILSIESATKVCSVALHDNGTLLAVIELHQDNVHSQKLMPMIADLLGQTGLTSSSLDAVAVSSGPGSYTGLRIGASMAKGLSFAHDIPLISVDTLKALALRAFPFCHTSDFIIPMMDARRMEIYAMVLDGERNTLVSPQPYIMDENPFYHYLQNGRVYFIGDGVEKSRAILSHPHAFFIPLYNSGISIGELAFQKFQKEEFENLAYFEPNYLKEFMVIRSKKNQFPA